MFSREGKLHPILAQVIADRDLPAERIPPPLQSELVKVIGAGLHQDWTTQFTQSQSIGNALFVAKVRQADEHTVDSLFLLTQDVTTYHRILPGLDCTKLD